MNAKNDGKYYMRCPGEIQVQTYVDESTALFTNEAMGQTQKYTYLLFSPARYSMQHFAVSSLVVDSEGVGYMYDTEHCDCNVQIIDRDERAILPSLGTPQQLNSSTSQKGYSQAVSIPGFCDFPNKSLLKKVAVLHACMISKLLHCVELYPWLLIETINWLKNHSELLGKKLQNWCVKMAYILLQGKVLKHLAFMQYIQGNDNKVLKQGRRKQFLNGQAPTGKIVSARNICMNNR